LGAAPENVCTSHLDLDLSARVVHANLLHRPRVFQSQNLLIVLCHLHAPNLLDPNDPATDGQHTPGETRLRNATQRRQGGGSILARGPVGKSIGPGAVGFLFGSPANRLRPTPLLPLLASSISGPFYALGTRMTPISLNSRPHRRPGTAGKRGDQLQERVTLISRDCLCNSRRSGV